MWKLQNSFIAPSIKDALHLPWHLLLSFFFSFLASQTVEVTYEVDEDDSGGVACTYGLSGIALLFLFGSNLTEESRNVPSFTIQKAPSNKFQNLTHSQI